MGSMTSFHSTGCPKQGLRKRELRDGMPYRTWAEQGFLELCEGNVIDYREVKARLIWGVQTFDLKEICFDPYNSRQLSTQLIDEGYECVEIRQGYATLSEPSKKILELVASGKLVMAATRYCAGMPLAFLQKRATTV